MSTTDDLRIVPGQLFYNVEQTTALLAMSRAKLHELTTRGEIPSVKIDGMRRYRRTDLEAYAEQVRAT